MYYILGFGFLSFAVSTLTNEECKYSGGKEYIINFPQNSQNANDVDLLLLFIVNTANVQTTVFFYSPFISERNLSLEGTVTINPSQVKSVQIPYELELKNIEISNKSLLVSSSENIIINVANARRKTEGMYLAFPTDRLGKNHIVLTYESDFETESSKSVIAVSSLNDATEVNFQFNKHVEVALPNGTSISGDFTVTLHKYETLQLKHRNLSGSLINSSKDILVVSGNEYLRTDIFNKTSKDSVMEQLLPVQSWSTEYLVVPSGNNQNAGEIVRVYCVKGSTTVTRRYNGLDTTYFLQNPGDSAEFIIAKSSASVVTADKNIAVMQIGVPIDVPNGDQYMFLTHPTVSFLNTYTFIVPVIDSYFTPEQTHGIIVYANEDARNSTFLDTIPIPYEDWTNFESYYFLDIPITEGLHRLHSTRSDGLLGGYIYGERFRTAYAMSIGAYTCESGHCKGDKPIQLQVTGNSTLQCQRYAGQHIDALEPIAVFSAISAIECAFKCQKFENCVYFSYDSDLSTCEIFNNFAVCWKDKIHRRQRFLYQKQ